jgi:hypothetical protein
MAECGKECGEDFTKNLTAILIWPTLTKSANNAFSQ